MPSVKDQEIATLSDIFRPTWQGSKKAVEAATARTKKMLGKLTAEELIDLRRNIKEAISSARIEVIRQYAGTSEDE